MSTQDPTLLDTFLQEVDRQFEPQLRTENLLAWSKELQTELRQHMISSPQCMLPSFNYELPTGYEGGQYLAVEVGGSNLRVALVVLNRGGLRYCIPHGETCFSIDTLILQLKEYQFFDWMAERIGEKLKSIGVKAKPSGQTEDNGFLPMGIAWSFPIDQTSIKSGNVLGMGKGFHCAGDLIGHDLGEIITKAFQRAVIAPSNSFFLRSDADYDALQKLPVRLAAIVNDSSSALLAEAYFDNATRLATVLGTGMNAAAYLPVAALDSSKFRSRSPSYGTFTHVVTNTELSMFGRNIFPKTRWDDILNAAHILPGYQPFEYLVAGKYIGEIVRLIIVEATQTAGLFNGVLPSSLGEGPYTLDTKDLAVIDIDRSNGLANSRALFHLRYPSSHRPTEKDFVFVREVVKWVSARSVKYFSVGIHALAALLQLQGPETNDMDHMIIVGCNGSIINDYPGYMEWAQLTLDEMIQSDDLQGKMRVTLKRTEHSALLGAALAVAMADGVTVQSNPVQRSSFLDSMKRNRPGLWHAFCS